MFAPAHVSVTPVTVPAAVPVLVTTRYAPAPAVVPQVKDAEPPVVTKSAAGAVTVVTWTLAVWDAEPKIPNTKPPIATAAMRVTAMISTVAMMGEIPLLPCLEKEWLKPSFKDSLSVKLCPYWKVPVNSTSAPLERVTVPWKVWPVTAATVMVADAGKLR